MRFLHTADLHIGKRLLETNLAEDQEKILSDIVNIAISEQCDAILISGDIYDKPTPSAEAMSIFDTFVSALVLGGVSVYAISGNHDSGERVNYFSGLLEKNKVYIQGKYEGELEHFTLQDEFGDLELYLLPFIKPIKVRGYFPEEEIKNYEDAVRTALSSINRESDTRKVLLSHQFVSGADLFGDEEMAIGGLECVSPSVYEGFDYVALGHIHRAQRVSTETIRYSGTPLKYSFSEDRNKNSVTIVDVQDKGLVQIKTVPLTPLHDMRVKRGTLDELMQDTYSEDYMEIILFDEEVPPDARITLFTRYPNMLKFHVENSKTATEWEAADAAHVELKTPLSMMEEFYRYQNNDVELPAEQRELLIELFESIGGEGE